MFARPLDGAFGQFVEAFRRRRERRLFVVITLNHWAIEFADKFDAFSRICIVTDHVAQTDKVCASALTRVGHHGFERFEV